jgi:hypothetical protein
LSDLTASWSLSVSVCLCLSSLSLSSLSRLLSLPLGLSVLPQQSLYTLFDPSTPLLEISVLHRNPHTLLPDTPLNSLVYNTRSEEVTKDLISPQCAVENFSEICIYSIVCQGRNVILKYQGAGIIELRKLTTTKLNKKGALSLFTSLLSSSSSPSPAPSPSSASATSPPPPSPSSSGSRAAAAAGTGTGDGKECILDFDTNATEISRDLASHHF